MFNLILKMFGATKPKQAALLHSRKNASGPLLGTGEGHRRVVLDGNWCGVVLQDYTVSTRKSGLVRLYDL
jgi:hypothetical protein